jgi:hypothetical protein
MIYHRFLYSIDSEPNKDYGDAGDTLNFYHVRVVGDFTTSVGEYEVFLSDPNSMALTRSSGTQYKFGNDVPSAGQGITRLHFLHRDAGPAD